MKNPLLHTRPKKLDAGFGLVELLVAVGILVTISSVVFFSFSGARAVARDNERVIQVDQLKLAVRQYADWNDQYPDYPDGVEIGVGGAIDAEFAPFLTEVPSGSDGVSYWYDSAFECNGVVRAVLYIEMETEGYSNYEEVCGPVASLDGDQRGSVFTFGTKVAYADAVDDYGDCSLESNSYLRSVCNSSLTSYCNSWYWSSMFSSPAKIAIRDRICTPPPPSAACSDGSDNDGDGDIDYPNDPGCSDAADDDETDTVVAPPSTPDDTIDPGVDAELSTSMYILLLGR